MRGASGEQHGSRPNRVCLQPALRATLVARTDEQFLIGVLSWCRPLIGLATLASQLSRRAFKHGGRVLAAKLFH